MSFFWFFVFQKLLDANVDRHIVNLIHNASGNVLYWALNVAASLMSESDNQTDRLVCVVPRLITLTGDEDDAIRSRAWFALSNIASSTWFIHVVLVWNDAVVSTMYREMQNHTVDGSGAWIQAMFCLKNALHNEALQESSVWEPFLRMETGKVFYELVLQIIHRSMAKIPASGRHVPDDILAVLKKFAE